MSELLIRPGRNDHRVIEELLGHSPTGGQRLVSGLVLDAQVAAARPQFAEMAEAHDTTVIIDPLTFLLQTEGGGDDSWVRLSFGRPEAVPPDELADPDVLATLVAEVVSFELEHGATAIVPPYLLIGDDYLTLDVSCALLQRTREYVDAQGLGLPIIPVLALGISATRKPADLFSSLGAVSRVAESIEPQAIAIALSGTGGGDDGDRSVRAVLQAVRMLSRSGAKVLAWRQGLLGPAAVAVGAAGYESGIGIREKCDLVGMQRARRPVPSKAGFGMPAGVFLSAFGRSFKKPVASALLEDEQLADQLACKDSSCCHDGSQSTLGDPRRHAVVSRAGFLRELDAMGDDRRRLSAIEGWAEAGADLAELSTEVLRSKGKKDSVNSKALNVLATASDLVEEG